MHFHCVPSRWHNETLVPARYVVSFSGLEYPAVLEEIDGSWALSARVSDWLDANCHVEVEIHSGDIGELIPTVYLDFPSAASAQAFITQWG